MPYIGLLPFLQKMVAKMMMAMVVSMPYIGLLPFLRVEGKEKSVENTLVSMPYIGLLPFLRGKR